MAGNTPSTGVAWAALEAAVDPLVQALIDDAGLPGVTVAATKDGRLVFAKGYGYARADGDHEIRMREGSRSKIGSTSKACVTGPATAQLMAAKGLDPATTRLYGPRGLFGGRFDADIASGVAASAPWAPWYATITVQHLLSHTAGFVRSSDIQGAAELFHIDEDDVTYEHLHRHILQKQKLLFEPGTIPADGDGYSNHGAGLCTLVIETLSGKSFQEYVRDDYLGPLGLKSRVRPEREHPDSCDAWQHARAADGTLSVLAFGDSGPLLAAGGFTASARDLTRIMAHLAASHTPAELDAMGWKAGARGRLEHSGKVSVGGSSHTVIFPAGYTSQNGLDLGMTTVAVATNVSTPTSALRTLASNVALAIPPSNVPVSYDAWASVRPDECEYVRQGLTTASYAQVFDDAVRAGYRLEWIDGYAHGAGARFNLIFRTGTAAPLWNSHHDMTSASYQEQYDEYKADGFSLVHVDCYAVGDSVRYAAIWARTGKHPRAYHGRTLAAHQELHDEWVAEGWRPKIVSVASVDGQRRYAAMYVKEDMGAVETRSTLSAAEYQATYDENKAKGRHLIYLKSYMHAGEPCYSAIWAARPTRVVRARHLLTSASATETRDDALSDGYRTRALTAYRDGATRFATYWTRPPAPAPRPVVPAAGVALG